MPFLAEINRHDLLFLGNAFDVVSIISTAGNNLKAKMAHFICHSIQVNACLHVSFIHWIGQSFITANIMGN